MAVLHFLQMVCERNEDCREGQTCDTEAGFCIRERGSETARGNRRQGIERAGDSEGMRGKVNTQ